jgi:hypothetical protein
MSDWSSYFSRAHKFLAQSEEELRLIHMKPVHLGNGRYYIEQAIFELELALRWISEAERTLDGR